MMLHPARFLLVAALAVTAFITPLHAGGKYVIVVDPGHGGVKSSGSQDERSLSSSNNATSPGGLDEKDLTLQLSKEVRAAVARLANQHKDTRLEILLTRETDTNPNFIQRAKFCAEANPTPTAIFSIHFNATDNHKGLGTLTLVHNKGKNANHAADTEFAVGLTAATSSAVARYVPGSKPLAPISDSHLHGGVGSNFFFQLGKHDSLKKVPKCFLEVEFIDRQDVHDKLLTQRDKAFPEIAESIAEYLYAYCATR